MEIGLSQSFIFIISMNINENIYRIKTLMGVVTESQELEETARPSKYSLEELEAIAKKYSNTNEWMNSKDEYDRKAYFAAVSIKNKGRQAEGLTKEDGKNWYERITAHFVRKRKYALGELEAIAKKYSNTTEWMNSKDEHDRKAYGAAVSIRRHGRQAEGLTKEDAKDWYNRITAHFVSKLNYYSLEELEAIAKKYNHHNEWKKSKDEYDRKAYRAVKSIVRRGRPTEGMTKKDGKDWYDKITAHFTRLHSNGEQMVQNFLDENNIKYRPERHLTGCVTPKEGKKRCGRLRYDFYLKELNILIEYDGKQHYKPVKRWGGEKGLEERKLRDKTKDEFAKSAGIPLIRIKYTYDTQEKINKVMEDVMSSLGSLEPIRRYE